MANIFPDPRYSMDIEKTVDAVLNRLFINDMTLEEAKESIKVAIHIHHGVTLGRIANALNSPLPINAALDTDIVPYICSAMALMEKVQKHKNTIVINE